MERRLPLILLSLILAGLLFFFTGTVLAGRQPQSEPILHAPAAGDAGHRSRPVGAQPDTSDSEPALRAPERISIPYGFADHLPLAAGTIVTASGHGGCTEGEVVTIDVTITQTIGGPAATGQTEQTCTGELQTWDVVATAAPGAGLVDGPATACGLATTRDQYGAETDTYAWCKAVTLNWQLYLPLTTR
jgi:hypothetical protein